MNNKEDAVSNSGVLCFSALGWKSFTVLMLCTLPFLTWSYAGVWEHLGQIHIGGALLGLALLIKRGDIRFEFIVPVILFFFLMILSWFMHKNAIELWQMLFCLFAAVAVFGGAHGRYSGFFVYFVLAGCVVNSLIGLTQWFGWAGHLMPIVFESPGNQVVGNLQQRNNLATLLVVGVAITAFLYQINLQHKKRKKVLFFLSMLFVLVIALTKSRIGLLGVLSVAVLSWWLLKNRVIPLVVMVGSGVFNLLLSLAGNGSSVERLIRGSSPCMSRLALWRDGLEMIGAQPVMGWGWGNLRYAQTFLAGEGVELHACVPLGNLHNMPLQVAASFGLPVFILVTVLFFWLFYKAVRLYDSGKAVYYIVLIPLFLHSMVEYPLHYAVFLIVLGWAVAGIFKGQVFYEADYKISNFVLGVAFSAFIVVFAGLEVANRTIKQNMSHESFRGFTSAEKFFFPAYTFGLDLYMVKLNSDTAKMKVDFSDSLLKTLVTYKLLGELKKSADWIGDEENSLRFERMMRNEIKIKSVGVKTQKTD